MWAVALDWRLKWRRHKAPKLAGWTPPPGLAGLAKSRCPGGDIRVGEIQELPFADGKFDVTTGFNSFQYATDPVHALAEAKRVTKANGYVVVAVWGTAGKCELAPYVAALGKLLPPPPPQAADCSHCLRPVHSKRWSAKPGLRPEAASVVMTECRSPTKQRRCAACLPRGSPNAPSEIRVNLPCARV